MARLFDRAARLTVVVPGQTVKITEQRISFRVDKFAGLENNSAVIQVYNLPEAARNLFVRRAPSGDKKLTPEARLTAFLYAGYVGQPLPLISRGVGFDIDAVNTRRGPDWITEFKTYSTIEQDVNARIYLTYINTPATVIMDDLIKAWGYPPVATAPNDVLVRLSTVLASYKVDGLVTGAIRGLLGRFDLTLTVNEDGRPILAVKGNSADAEVPEADLPLIDERSGMIGSPQITTSGISVQTLLDSRIAPLRSFVVGSDTLTSTLNVFRQRYTAKEVQHVGDVRGGDWFTDATGVYPAFARTGEAVPLQPQEPVQ